MTTQSMDLAELDALVAAFREQWPGAGDPQEQLALNWGTEPQGNDDTVFEFMNGRCHDFALGLAIYLANCGVACEAALFCRRTAAPGMEPEMSYLHTALMVAGRAVDINGVQCPIRLASNLAAELTTPGRSELVCVLRAPDEVAPFIRETQRAAGIPRHEGASIHIRVAQRVAKAFQQLSQGKPVQVVPPPRGRVGNSR